MMAENSEVDTNAKTRMPFNDFHWVSPCSMTAENSVGDNDRQTRMLFNALLLIYRLQRY